ncbi:MAG: hypothetical protein Q8Q85_12680 [Gemmatimonadales bacterium]|nr:hypothetical protein [Gemmatimonadales bacterium]
MFPVLEWWGYLAIAALPVLGFGLGARWMYWRERMMLRPPEPPATPLPSGSDLDTRMIGAVESLQRQLEELAERQDFAERMLAQRSPQLPAGGAAREQDTPA